MRSLSIGLANGSSNPRCNVSALIRRMMQHKVKRASKCRAASLVRDQLRNWLRDPTYVDFAHVIDIDGVIFTKVTVP
jgi:hypothetical protein